MDFLIPFNRRHARNLYLAQFARNIRRLPREFSILSLRPGRPISHTDELFPFVEQNFRTKNFRTPAGPQAGASFALYVLFHRPDIFNIYVSTNPFLYPYQVGRDYFIENATAFTENTSSLNRFYYLSYFPKDGFIQQTEANQYVERLEQIFKSRTPEGFQFQVKYIPDNRDFIPPTGLKSGLEAYFDEYDPGDRVDFKTLKEVEEYYHRLSIQYGYVSEIRQCL